MKEMDHDNFKSWSGDWYPILGVGVGTGIPFWELEWGLASLFGSWSGDCMASHFRSWSGDWHPILGVGVETDTPI